MVNTFLTRLGKDNFARSAQDLDTQRLNKQCVEAKQIISAIIATAAGKPGKKPGFSNHPATKQWQGHLDALKYYFNVHRLEAIKRGTKMSMLAYDNLPLADDIVMPWFVQCPHFVYSHCAQLYKKMKWYYADVLTFPHIYLNYGYFWPSHHVKPAQVTTDADSVSTTSTTDIDNRQLMFDALTTAENDWPHEPKMETKDVKECKSNDIKYVIRSSLADALLHYCEKPRSEEKQCEGIIKSGENAGNRCTTRAKQAAKSKSKSKTPAFDAILGKARASASASASASAVCIRPGNFCGTHQKLYSCKEKRTINDYDDYEKKKKSKSN